MTKKLSDKDKRDWLNFLNSSEKLHGKDKDIEISNKTKILKRTIDLHGFTLEEANKEISKFIENCYLNKSLQLHILVDINIIACCDCFCGFNFIGAVH